VYGWFVAKNEFLATVTVPPVERPSYATANAADTTIAATPATNPTDLTLIHPVSTARELILMGPSLLRTRGPQIALV
jgi:hypothetical protein